MRKKIKTSDIEFMCDILATFLTIIYSLIVFTTHGCSKDSTDNISKIIMVIASVIFFTVILFVTLALPDILINARVKKIWNCLESHNIDVYPKNVNLGWNRKFKVFDTIGCHVCHDSCTQWVSIDYGVNEFSYKVQYLSLKTGEFEVDECRFSIGRDKNSITVEKLSGNHGIPDYIKFYCVIKGDTQLIWFINDTEKIKSKNERIYSKRLHWLDNFEVCGYSPYTGCLVDGVRVKTVNKIQKKK